MSTNEVAGGAATNRKQRYQPLPKDESSLHELNGDEVLGCSSVVAVENLHLDGPCGEPPQGESDAYISIGTTDDVFRKPYEDSPEERSKGANSSTGNGSIHLVLSRSHGSDDSDLLIDSSDWDEEEDEAGLRRYHIDFKARTDIPLPAEFSHDSLPKRIWQSFVDLQAAARQRRAARLLNMPSQSFRHQLHSCILTWCCDATDIGILVLATCLTVWFFIGIAARMRSSWWWIGILLFCIRISARRIFEYFQGKQRRRRQRLPTVDAVELANSAMWSDARKDSNHG